MQVDIKYETNDDADVPVAPEPRCRGRDHFGIGKTWEQAKANLLKKLDAKHGRVAPPPETVEVKVAGEEMDTEFVTKDGIPWGPLESREEPVRRAKVHFEGGQVVTPEDREIEAGKV